ncbi:MAG: tetratricopeptide repeat protein [Bryobacterales bacterium]
MSVFRLFLVAALAAGLASAEEAPRAQDTREYELVQGTLGERDPAKRLATLETWRQEYPSTALGEMRAKLYLQTYREAGRHADAVAAAERVLELAPEDFAAHYTLASLAPALGSIDEADRARAERSARELLDGGIATQFDLSNKPTGVTADAWESARVQSEAASLRTLGWLAMERKQPAEAQSELERALRIDPTSAQASYWLAQSVLAQRDPGKNELAFFSLARAATLTGPGELPAESREQIRAYLQKTYQAFAGTLDGLDEIERLAALSALPPAEMPRVRSAAEREDDAHRAFCTDKPLACVYENLRAALTGPDGPQTWAELQEKVTPQIELYVVGNEPADRPLALRLSPQKGGKAEVVLELSNRLRGRFPPGAR